VSIESFNSANTAVALNNNRPMLIAVAIRLL